MEKISYCEFCKIFGVEFNGLYFLGDSYIQLCHKVYNDYLVLNHEKGEELLEVFKNYKLGGYNDLSDEVNKKIK